MPHPVYPHPDRLAGDEATDGVWAVAKFVREGSNMLRMMGSTLLVLRACMDIRVGPPPAAAQALSFELSRFCISQYSVSRATRSVRAYVALWQAHLRLWNGFPGQERIEVWVDQAVDVEGHLRAMAKTFNDAARTQLLFGGLGFGSMRELAHDERFAACAHMHCEFGRGVSAALYRRRDMPRREMLLLVVQLADQRISVGERMELARRPGQGGR